MALYLVKTYIVREVEAQDEEEAHERFWIELEDECSLSNTTIDNMLNDSIEIEKLRED